jgi:SAM-dependent methyltransferase
MRDQHRRWDEAEVIAQFAHKGVGDFFRSETRYLEEIAADIGSVLDVGCASGRFIELLRHYGVEPDFTGVDVSAASVAHACAAYPQARFIAGDALDLTLDATFDLVNATGVCQHEPRFETLIRRMVDWSARYVLFDVKLAPIDAHLIDIGRAYCGAPGNRLHYMVLAPRLFCAFLQGLGGIGHISIYGYETPLNARTVIPKGIGPIVSAGVLLEKGSEKEADLRLELPSALQQLVRAAT